MDDDTGTGTPPEETVPEGQATPDPPRPSTIEAFCEYKNRIEADKAAGGTIGSLMLEYANAAGTEMREKLENDVGTFLNVWDQFASSLPPPPAPSPAPAPVEPSGYVSPAWRKVQLERSAKNAIPIMDSRFSIPAGSMPLEGATERVEARKHTQEVGKILQRIRESGGRDKDAEVSLAQALGLGNLRGR